jgi:hypothetical protein
MATSRSPTIDPPAPPANVSFAHEDASAPILAALDGLAGGALVPLGKESQTKQLTSRNL